MARHLLAQQARQGPIDFDTIRIHVDEVSVHGDGVRLEGLREIDGLELTVSVTDTVRGELVAPAAVTVIVALYVPAASAAALYLTAIASFSPVELPEVGVQLSQVALSLME